MPITPLYDRLSKYIATLKGGKHLLGFSGGVDSVALFFILLKLEITFDIAIVHYHTREEADDEVAYAKDLAMRYNKLCFVSHSPHFENNFEHNARTFRFDFFDKIISTHNYQSLILAHQLNDRFEWFMMQLTQGTGLSNILGFEYSRSYPIVRPLESISKAELYRFCKDGKFKYFEDKSNENLAFKRNYFRHHFCTPLLEKFSSGIAKSMSYLQKDRDYLLSILTCKTFPLKSLAQNLPEDSKRECDIFAFPHEEEYLLLLACDKIAKKCGYVLSAAQRKEIVKSHFSCKIHNLIIEKNNYSLFIAMDVLSKYRIVTQKPMAKNFKNLCAKLNIPPKIRILLWEEFRIQNDFEHKIPPQQKQYSYEEFATQIKNFFA